MERDVLCNVGTTRFSRKPSAADMSQIHRELSAPKYINIRELAERLGNGVSFRPAAIQGTHDEDFVSQTLYALDFDNSDGNILLPEEAIEQAHRAGCPPAFCYLSFSSTESQPKYRLVFCADAAITNRADRDAIQYHIMDLFEGSADKRCGNPSRLFFGGKSGVLWHDYDAVFDAGKMLSEHPSRRPASKPMVSCRIQGREISHKPRNDMDIVEAIRNHNIHFLQKKLGKNHIEFNNKKEFFDYIYRELDLSEFLGVEPKRSFPCILPSHGGLDENPSASVFQTRGGVWQYKCFSEDISLNIKQLIEILGNFNSEFQALEFLKSVCNLKIRETAWSREQNENIDNILYSLSTSDELSFEALCPTASHNVRNARMLYLQVLAIAKSSIFPDKADGSGNVLFYMSNRQLAKATGKSSIDKTSKYLKMLIYHGLLEIVPDEHVPPALLKKALDSAKNGHAHISFYEIPSWVFQRLQYVEAQGHKWKDNHYRLNGISYEMFYRAEGPEVAGMLYPQTSRVTKTDGTISQKGTGEEADNLHIAISEVILEEIERKGYCRESEVIEALRRNYGRHITEIQLKRSLTDILSGYGLIRQRAKKSLKQEFGMNDPGYPFIICKRVP